MKKLMILFILLGALEARGQTGKGIIFEQEMTWRQIQEKAKEANKYIFVDCYATWCVPCTAMDKVIYSNDTVGTTVNAKFISIKVQFDTTKSDNEFIKSWYTDAHHMEIGYHIVAYPTFLFFSPDGRIIHKEVGFKNKKEFLALINDAQQPEKQYYSLLDKFESGLLSSSQMLHLSQLANSYHERQLAQKIAAARMHDYLDKLTDDAFCTKPNIEFIVSFSQMIQSNDRIFKLCYNHPERIDSIMGTTVAQKIVDGVIKNEEIIPKLNQAKIDNSVPNWSMLYQNIDHKYSTSYAKRIIANSKPSFYKQQKDWKNYTKSLIESTESKLADLNSSVSGVELNTNAWEVFQYSENKSELKKALTWSEKSANLLPQRLRSAAEDTEANLLYKLGFRERAIMLETQVFASNPGNASFAQTLEQMKKGQPTW